MYIHIPPSALHQIPPAANLVLLCNKPVLVQSSINIWHYSKYILQYIGAMLYQRTAPVWLILNSTHNNRPPLAKYILVPVTFLFQQITSSLQKSLSKDYYLGQLC